MITEVLEMITDSFNSENSKEASEMSDRRDVPRLANEIDCRPRMDYNNHLGALQGCMDRLGVEVERAWLYGVTGYAFMINIPRGVYSSGPTAWNWNLICERTPNIGIDTSEYVLSFKEYDDFDEKKKEAISFTTEKFNRGVPLYGAEFGHPEFYTINGTSKEGFTYVETNGLARTWLTTFRTWEMFGTVDVGILFVGAVQKSEGTADDYKAVADALNFALAVGHAETGYPQSPLGFRDAQMGLLAYDMWITSLSDGSLAEGLWNHPHGTGYNALFWHESRVRAEEFLRLCPKKLSGTLEPEFARAADVYGEVAEALAKLKAVSLGDSPDLPSEVVAEASKYLREAKEAESRGLDLLANIRKAL